MNVYYCTKGLGVQIGYSGITFCNLHFGLYFLWVFAHANSGPDNSLPKQKTLWFPDELWLGVKSFLYGDSTQISLFLDDDASQVVDFSWNTTIGDQTSNLNFQIFFTKNNTLKM